MSAYALQAARDQSGFAAVEFALIMPVLLFFVLGGLILGVEYNDFIVITNAAQVGTFQLTVSRGVQQRRPRLPTALSIPSPDRR